MPWYSGAKCNRLVQWIFKKKEQPQSYPQAGDSEPLSGKDLAGAGSRGSFGGGASGDCGSGSASGGVNFGLLGESEKGGKKRSRRGLLEPIFESTATVAPKSTAKVVVTSPTSGNSAPGFPRSAFTVTKLAIVKPVHRDDDIGEVVTSNVGGGCSNVSTQCDLHCPSGASSSFAVSPSSTGYNSHATSPHSVTCPVSQGVVGGCSCACSSHPSSPLAGGARHHQLFLHNKRRASLQVPIMESAREVNVVGGTSGSIPEQSEIQEEDVFHSVSRRLSHVSSDAGSTRIIEVKTVNIVLFSDSWGLLFL